MPILNVQISQTGLSGVYPRIVYINTNDTQSEVLETGYLNQAVANGFSFTNFDIACVSTAPSESSLAVSTGWYNISNVGTNWSLVPTVNPGTVVLPTKIGHIATYSDVNGTLTEDAAAAINGGNIQAGLSGTAGKFRSYPSAAAKGYLEITGVANTGNTATTISNAAMGQQSTISIPDPGASTASFIISSRAGSATQIISTGALATTAGNMQAGSGGTAGKFISYPETALTGSFHFAAVANTGNTITTLSNAAMNQASVISIPDPGAATANLLIAATNTPFVSGNFPKASGTTGLMVDSGAGIRSGVTGTYAGGGTSNAFTVTGMTSAWIVTAVNLTSTNSVSITKVVPSANTLTITWSADPGAGTTVNWIATTASA